MLDSLFNVGNPSLGIIFLGVKDSLTPAVSGCVAAAQKQQPLPAVLYSNCVGSFLHVYSVTR
jgi:hypothetical protein